MPQMPPLPEPSLLDQIVSPTWQMNIRRLQAGRVQLVHYTSADVAIRILQKGEFWMRSTRAMNDTSELRLGLNAYDLAKDSLLGEWLSAALNDIRPGIASTFRRFTDSAQMSLYQHTYVACLSQHRNDEALTGRLSMWRAYGGHSPVAFVFRGRELGKLGVVDGLNLQPVVYGSHGLMSEHIHRFVQRLREYKTQLQALPPGEVVNAVASWWRNSIVLMKDANFKEESEWRVFANFVPSNGPVVESVAGVPQLVMKIPIFGDGRGAVDGRTVERLISQIVVGPCEHQTLIGIALREALRATGVKFPERIVRSSTIPLRTR